MNKEGSKFDFIVHALDTLEIKQRGVLKWGLITSAVFDLSAKEFNPETPKLVD